MAGEMSAIHLPQWAPRVKQALIQRLYESDAQGRLDNEAADYYGDERLRVR
jgi:hypothetical protein